MKKAILAVKPAKRVSTKSTAKSTSSRRNKVGSTVRRPKKRSFLNDVLGFRWLKKAMVGKTQEESLDLLDEWILRKKALRLFS
jgi:hypothetical protein